MGLSVREGAGGEGEVGGGGGGGTGEPGPMMMIKREVKYHLGRASAHIYLSNSLNI